MYCGKCGTENRSEAKFCIHCGQALIEEATKKETSSYLYEAKKTLLSKSEQLYFEEIKKAVPNGYCVFPQINLATIIKRTDNSRFQNELYRNTDFLITDENYRPLIVIEINDLTHLNNDRKKRDEKVKNICDEAGLPIIMLWTSYGVNPEYIKTRITETLSSLPYPRIRHFNQEPQTPKELNTPPSYSPSTPPSYRKQGCYIATCVYGSYDCPEVWTLRRFRDFTLAKTMAGLAFIRVYYAISPWLVQRFGKSSWFLKMSKSCLDQFVNLLQKQGWLNTPYED